MLTQIPILSRKIFAYLAYGPLLQKYLTPGRDSTFGRCIRWSIATAVFSHSMDACLNPPMANW